MRDRPIAAPDIGGLPYRLVTSQRSHPMTDASSPPAADIRMDLVGQACATLTPLIAARMRQLESGQVLEVISDDPTARSGLASWSRLTGNPMMAIIDDGPGRTRYYLRRK
jgi:tRNA 2-thiouridine synthesizing protein A